MIFNFIVSYTVSRLTPEPPQEIKDLVDNIRIPKGAGETYPITCGTKSQ
jgi:cation/acetate symporter